MNKFNKDVVYNELVNLAKNSYSPYSNFRVSCIIYLKNNVKVMGVNVENAAYNPSICAERTALSQLYTLGYNGEDVELIALYTDSEILGSPCGTCRQCLNELLLQDQKMWIFTKKGFGDEFTIAQFLPWAFSEKQLKS